MGAQFGAATLPLGLPALGPFLRTEFGVSLAALGALLAAPTLGIAATSFVWGALSDRLGERRVMVAGLLVAAAILVAAAWARSAAVFGTSMALSGAFGAAAPAASGKAVVGWFPATERGFALSLRHTAPMAGGAFSAALLPVVAAAEGLRGACLFLAALAVAGAVSAALVLPAPAGDADAGAAHAPPPTRDSLVWTMALGGSLVIVAQGVLTRFLSEYMHAERGWSQAAAGATLSITLLVAAVMRVGTGIISDRHGRRITTLRNQAAIAAVVLVVAAASSSAPALVAAALLVFASGMTMAGNGVAWAAVSEISPTRAGAALGLYSTMLVAASTVAPPLFGAVVGDSSLGPAFGAVAAFPLLGAVAFWAAARAWARRRAR